MNDSEIREGEHHPAADSAMAWLKGYMVQHPDHYLLHKEAMAESSTRLGQICTGTIDRLANGDPVSDRYILGLAWTMMKLTYWDEMSKTEKYRIDQ